METIKINSASGSKSFLWIKSCEQLGFNSCSKYRLQTYFVWHWNESLHFRWRGV